MATFVWASAIAGNWSIGANWQVAGVPQGSPPTAADDVLLGSGTGATQSNNTIDSASVCRSIDCTGYTGTLAHGSGISLSVGDASGGAFTLVSGMTYTPTGSASAGLRFVSTSTNGGVGWSIITAGKSMGVNGTSNQFTGVGGKWVLQDTWSQVAGAGITVSGGELDTGNQSIQTGSFLSSGTNVRVLTLGSSTITLLTTAAATVWNFTGSSATVNAGTCIIVIGAIGANTRTFAGNGYTYGTLTYTIPGSTGSLSITGSNTFTRLNFSDVTNARTLTLAASSTQTISYFNVNGLSGKLITISPVTSSSLTLLIAPQYNNYISVSNLTVGTNTLYAVASTDGGGNSGIIFIGSNVINNYQFVKAGDGMSVTEKIK